MTFPHSLSSSLKPIRAKRILDPEAALEEKRQALIKAEQTKWDKQVSKLQTFSPLKNEKSSNRRRGSKYL
jgi:hypothetical protein